MNRNARRLAVGAMALVFGLALLSSPADRGYAADDEELKKDIMQIADLLEKGKKDEAKKQAEAVAKKNNFDGFKVGSVQALMQPLKLRNNKGYGVGEKPGAIKPDGIEAKIMDLGKKKMSPAKLKEEGPELKKAAYVTLAIAEITAFSGPSKEDAKKKKKDWDLWTKEMKESSEALIKALESPKPDEKAILNAAKSMDGSCTSCHTPFRPSS